MNKYEVTFCQYRSYTVEAEDENAAINEAKEEFTNEMSYPVAHTDYDEIIIEEIE